MNGFRKYTRSLSCGNSEVQGATLNNKTQVSEEGPLTRLPYSCLEWCAYPKGRSRSILGCVECHPEGAVHPIRQVILHSAKDCLQCWLLRRQSMTTRTKKCCITCKSKHFVRLGSGEWVPFFGQYGSLNPTDPPPFTVFLTELRGQTERGVQRGVQE